MMDERAQRSVTLLREALLACMAEAPVRDIQVKEICAKAGLNRTTFYKHYSDVNGIVEELEQEQLERFAAPLREKKQTGAALLRELLQTLDEVRQLYRANSGGEVTESLKNGLIETAKRYGAQAWKEKLPKVPPEEAETVYEALAAGALHAALHTEEEHGRETVIKTVMEMAESYISAHA